MILLVKDKEEFIGKVDDNDVAVAFAVLVLVNPVVVFVEVLAFFWENNW